MNNQMQPNVDVPAYTFNLVDESAWLSYFREHGYVVLKNVGNRDQVEVAKANLWDAICKRKPGVRQDDSSTWSSLSFGPGLIPWLAQSAGAWDVRGWPGVKQAFACIWSDDDLIVSMDCVLMWLPWWQNSEWRPVTEGLHLDQNPFTKPGFECVQGMVPLLPVTAASGGLEVVPGSHTDSAKVEFKKRHSEMQHGGDWCPCPDPDLEEKALLLLAEPGDLVLWDSRTVHGGHVGTGLEGSNEPELARLSVTVAMVPRRWASAEVLEKRRQGFMRGENFNHSPHEAGTSTGTFRAPVPRTYVPITLSPAQEMLL